MLSTFPTQKYRTMSSKLIVPMMNWFLITFLPLRVVFSKNWQAFIAANGQFICFSRKTYNSIGGHEAVKDAVVEDMEFARIVKSRKLSMMTTVGDDSIFCNMYGSFQESWNGFSKNFFPGFNMPASLFILLLLSIYFVFFLPFILVFISYMYSLLIALIIVERFIQSLIVKEDPIFNIIFYPIQILMMLIVGINSIYATRFGKRKWKGRVL